MPLVQGTSAEDTTKRLQGRAFLSNYLINKKYDSDNKLLTQSLGEASLNTELQTNKTYISADELASILATVPNPPTSVVATKGNTEAYIYFSAPIDGGSPILAYQVMTTGQKVTGTSSPITVSGLTNGTSYTFSVTAINAIGTSIPGISNAIIPSTVPSPPTNLLAIPSSTSVSISFTAGDDGGSYITNYQYTTGLTFTPFSPPQTTSPLIITGLEPGTSYTLRLKAINANGPSSPVTVSFSTLSLAVAPTLVSGSFTQSSYGTGYGIFTGTIISNGGSTITAMGVVYSTSNNMPTLSNSKQDSTVIQSGSFTVNISGYSNVYARAYATNIQGTTYGDPLSLNITICLAKGTIISLSNGQTKLIEDITYSDELLVWDFDEGVFASAKPLWVKRKQETDRYNLLTFSDLTTLKTINQHRIFNREKGKFTYPMSDDTPIGTTTFCLDKTRITLMSKITIEEPIEFYNIITYRHINLFANGILTSCRYNNLYPITDMKFIKDNRPQIQKVEEIPSIYYEGLRISEQTIPISDTIKYVERLEELKQ